MELGSTLKGYHTTNAACIEESAIVQRLQRWGFCRRRTQGALTSFATLGYVVKRLRRWRKRPFRHKQRNIKICESGLYSKLTIKVGPSRLTIGLEGVLIADGRGP